MDKQELLDWAVANVEEWKVGYKLTGPFEWVILGGFNDGAEVFSEQWRAGKGKSATNTQNRDAVKSPKHYELIDGVEAIEVIASSMTSEQWKGYCLGNALKYRLRAGKKDALQQDIDKADFYTDVLYDKHKHLNRAS